MVMVNDSMYSFNRMEYDDWLYDMGLWETRYILMTPWHASHWFSKHYWDAKLNGK